MTARTRNKQNWINPTAI